MDEKQARKLIIKCNERGDYVKWRKNDQDSIVLDGDFNVSELEAFAWWLRNKSRDKCTPEHDGQILCALGDDCHVDCGIKDSCEWYE